MALFTAVHHIGENLEVLMEEGTTKNILDKMDSFKEYTSLVGLPELQVIEKKYVDRFIE